MTDSSQKSPAEKPRIALGADHAGFQAKENLKRYPESTGRGKRHRNMSEESVDYPDFAIKVARHVQQGESDFGILVCGTGIGMRWRQTKSAAFARPWRMTR